MTRDEPLGALYHWSPADRRAAILKEGLHPFQPPSVASGVQPYVSLGPTPSSAWSLSGDMEWTEVDEWDLWQVRLPDECDVRIRCDFAPFVREVKVHGPIPADRVWWVARRPVWLLAEDLRGSESPSKRQKARGATGRRTRRAAPASGQASARTG